MKKINWKNIRLILMLCIVAFLFGFSLMKNEQRKVTSQIIEFLDDQTPYVSHNMVNKLLIQNKIDAPNITKDKVDLKTLEQAVESHEMVRKAEIFMTIDGKLKVEIKQKMPLVRIISDSLSCYIDEKGDFMPLSENFSGRVPIVSGEINQKNKNKYLSLFTFIHNDAFLSRNIIGVNIMANGTVYLKNRNYGFSVFLGFPKDIEKKFMNYKVFYQKAVKDGTIGWYDTVNLVFTKQVVCVK